MSLNREILYVHFCAAKTMVYRKERGTTGKYALILSDLGAFINLPKAKLFADLLAQPRTQLVQK